MTRVQEDRGEGKKMQEGDWQGRGGERESGESSIRRAWNISLRTLAFSFRGRKFEEFQPYAT